MNTFLILTGADENSLHLVRGNEDLIATLDQNKNTKAFAVTVSKRRAVSLKAVTVGDKATASVKVRPVTLANGEAL